MKESFMWWINGRYADLLEPEYILYISQYFDESMTLYDEADKNNKEVILWYNLFLEHLFSELC